MGASREIGATPFKGNLLQYSGLGSDETVDVLVCWPSGTEDRLSNVAANQMVEIVEEFQ